MNWAEKHFWECHKCLSKYANVPITSNHYMDYFEWKCIREQILADCIGFAGK